MNKLLAIIFALLFIQPIAAYAELTPQVVQHHIDHILATYPEDLNIGIVVQDMQTGNILYAHSADRLLMPASNLKLFTAVAALSYLHADYSFSTQLFTDATQPPKQGILSGNVYLKFSGDPTFSLNDLNNLLARLPASGIHTINGNLYLDVSTYDQVELGPGWMWDDLSYAFAAPINAFMLNGNRLRFSLIPTTPGQLSKIAPADLPFIAHIDNHVTTVKDHSACEVTIESDLHNHYLLSGYVNKAQPPVCVELAVRNLHKYASAALHYALVQQQLILNGDIAYRTVPTPSIVIAQHNSLPLIELVKTMLKDSDNVIASTLFKTIGARYFQQQGTWKSGSLALQAILKPLTGLNFCHSSIKDGSGMSSYNLITPMQIAQLLKAAYDQPELRAALWQSLPLAGIDGTLKHRMQNTPAQGNVRAKTGTMASISALSGYLTTRSHHDLAFVVIINGFSSSPEHYQQLEDQICQQLVRL